MATSFNSPSKQFIRINWGKPLLAFLNQRLRKRLFYLGLPSPDAEDIETWMEHLERIYAFQCRQYPLPSDDTQPRDAILQLEAKLLTLERTRQINTFDVFDGYIEEVLLKGKDNSPNQKTYSQNEIVTVYNLDFCNQITEPIKFIDENGNEVEAFKMEAIKKLIEFQNNVASNSSKFILFLTIHASYRGETLLDFINDPPTNYLSNYFFELNKLTHAEKKIRILKAFVFESINEVYRNFGFCSEFLPVIVYFGDGNHKLLHFTVIGTRYHSKNVGKAATFQRIENFVSRKLIKIESDEFQNLDSNLVNTIYKSLVLI